MVALYHPLLGVISYEMEHAQRILDLEKQLGVDHPWVLEDENYLLKDGKIERRTGIGSVEHTEEP